jgi:hypothetical protein
MTGGGVAVDNQYGMATVDLNNIGYKGPINDEPKRHTVLSGKRNIVGIKDKSDMSEDYEKDDQISPFTVNKDPSI